MISAIGLLLSASLAPASAAPKLITCGATVTGAAAVLTADLVCPSGHGLVVVGRSEVLDCAGHRITEATARDNTASTSATVRARW